MKPGQHVQVESGKSHDGVVGVLLVRNNQVGCLVPGEGEFVESAEGVSEVRWCCAEQRNVLKVGVVLRHVRYEMVHVVRALPPANRKSAAEIGDESANDCVNDKVARDSAMSSVMRGEHDLLLEFMSVGGQVMYRSPHTYPKHA